MKDLTGKKVYIIDKQSDYFREWGTIVQFDSNNEIYVAIANGQDSIPLFSIDQLKVAKNI